MEKEDIEEIEDIESESDSDVGSGSESETEYDDIEITKKIKSKYEDDDEEDDDDEENDEDNDETAIGDEITNLTEIQPNTSLRNLDDLSEDDEDDEDDLDENYLQKFDKKLSENIITDYHPELNTHNYEEVETACIVVRDEHGTIIDPLHKTLPFVTKYEKARIIGERAKQLNSGAAPFIDVEPSMIDGYLIALKEFEEKKIPFIVRRPLPSGLCEYWKLKDLEILD
jgi:DNA-directed RNA polymerase I, II, and III subunit RPABC2